MAFWDIKIDLFKPHIVVLKRLPKLNTKTTKKINDKTNDQSRIRADHEYQKMIRRVLDEVFPI